MVAESTTNKIERLLERIVRLEVRVEQLEKKANSTVIPDPIPVEDEELMKSIDAETKEMIKELTKNLSVLSGLDPEEIAPFDFNFRGELEQDDDIDETSVEGITNNE